MMNHKKDVSMMLVSWNHIFPDNVVKKPNEMEKRMFRFLHKQHHKNTILFPYNFKRVLLSCAHFIFLNPC